MSPVRALEGVGSGASAIHDFNETAARFASVVATLPELIRWELELLLFEVEERQSVTRLLAALESVSESAVRASLAIDRLPGDLQTTMGGSREVLDAASATIREAQLLLVPFAVAAEEIRLTTAAVAEITAQEPDAEPGRAFDIREWETAAREIGVASGELRGAASEILAVVESGGLDGKLLQVSDAVERAEVSAQAIVDAAAWRVLQLLLVAFALLVLYRLVAARFLRA